MRLILKNRLCGIIVLSIYLNAIFEFILPTNGSSRVVAVGGLTQTHKQIARLEHLLLSGTYASNKARSPLIKSIVLDGPNSKEPFADRVEDLQENLINRAASSEYSRNNKIPSTVKIIKSWKGLNDQNSFGWNGRHIQNKLLFRVTSSNGARGNDPSHSYLNQRTLNNSSSVDIRHSGSDNDRSNKRIKISNDKSFQNLNNNVDDAVGDIWHGNSNAVLRYVYNNTVENNADLHSDNVTFQKFGFHRNKRSSDEADRLVTEFSETRNVDSINRIPTGTDIYYRLVEYINLFLNMSNDEGNFTTYTVPKVIAVYCPEVIEELYRTVVIPDDGKLYCNSSWDEYSCWPRTLAGTHAVIPCPGYLSGIDESDNATKYCHENGTWAERAKYDNCLDGKEVAVAEDPHTRAILYIYHIGFSISTLTLLIALFIFLYFRSLRCLRNSIHCHLIVSFIFMNIMWIIMRHTLIPLAAGPHQWLMKVEIALFNYSQGTNFFWMFVEGLYLHIIIVWTYSADKIKLRYLFVIGWIIPAHFTIAWVIVMQTLKITGSWMPESVGENWSGYEYIYVTPILVVLFTNIEFFVKDFSGTMKGRSQKLSLQCNNDDFNWANIIFLSTIVWVLITKLRASHTLETRQYRKAVKATVILFPLLGITYVLFIVPPSNDPQVHVIFNYINAILQSLQGFFVAVFYCFLNGEVKGVLKKRLLRFNDARSLSTKYTKTSVAWTRASRDYTTSASFGNGALPNPRRFNGQQSYPEQIPLKTREEYENEDCTE